MFAQKLAAAHSRSRGIGLWRGKLLGALAFVEAPIDFADEADVETMRMRLQDRVRGVQREVQGVLDDGSRGERLRDGLTIVVAGPPNSGKSTLINALARRDVAIVSPVPGTTRDPIEVHLDLAGVPVILIDTAGLRDVDDAVEAIGVERARQRVARANLVFGSASRGAGMRDRPREEKRDPKFERRRIWRENPKGKTNISAMTGAGISEFLSLLTHGWSLAGAGENVLVAPARQRSALTACVYELRSFLDMEAGITAELRAEHLRLALRALGRLVGEVDVEEMLGEIFKGFCIGK